MIEFSRSFGVFRNLIEQTDLKFRGLLRPADHLDLSGLYLLRPYQRDKIPVVFIHGLKSTPATWLRVVSMVFEDPQLRNVFQPLVYYYPTGLPIFFNVLDFKKRLENFVSRCGCTNIPPSMKEMVLVGHSMGGILANAQIRTSDEKLTDYVFNELSSKQDISKQEYEYLSDICQFKANPNIKRVIFVCTPHRGTYRAGSWIARIVAALVKQEPGRIDKIIDAGGNRGFQYSKNVPLEAPLLGKLSNGIEELQVGSTILKSIRNWPIQENVHFHSIIGNRGINDSLKNSNDGWVPYWSAHLDGADSELIVPASHAATNHKDTVKEIRRILSLHRIID